MLENKDYCDYETCVALKELGYSEDFILAKDYEILDREYDILLYEAQKWLREEKKIEIVVLGQNSIGGPYYPDIYTEDGLMNNAKGYKTYEEALSEGLRASIKILQDEQKENN